MKPSPTLRPAAAIAGLMLGAGLASCTGSPPSGNGDPGGARPGASSDSGAPADPNASLSKREFPLDSLRTATVSINGNSFRVWLATTIDQQAEGLMHVPSDSMAADQGMLFVFPREDYRSFWMKNTIMPLDIAFARADGRIIRVWTMPPLTLETFPSGEVAMFALEVHAGTFERLGIRPGDKIVIPPDVLKP